MRKSIGFLSLVVFIFVTCFAGSACAEMQISWFNVQKRAYEDGRQFTRIEVGVNEQIVTDIKLYEGMSLLPVEFDDYSLDEIHYYTANYQGGNGIWNWSSLGSDRIVVYNFFGDFSFDLKEWTTYTIEVYYNEGMVSQSKFFTEAVELPIVSLAKGIKKKGKEIKPEFLDDGSMVVRWDAPTTTHEYTYANVYLTLKYDGGLFNNIYIGQPTHVGMVIIPPSVISKLQGDLDYQGFFDFKVQLRTTDNCNRTYSNWCRYYFE